MFDTLSPYPSWSGTQNWTKYSRCSLRGSKKLCIVTPLDLLARLLLIGPYVHLPSFVIDVIALLVYISLGIHCHFQALMSGLLLSQSIPARICVSIRFLCPLRAFTLLELYKMSVDQPSALLRPIRTKLFLFSLIITSPSLLSSTNCFLSIQITDETIQEYGPQLHLFLAANQISSYWLLLITLSSLFTNRPVFSPNFITSILT